MNICNFKKVLYAVCRTTKASVEEYYEASVTPNFHATKVHVGSETLFILNSVHDDWAFSRHFDPTSCQLDFIDSEELATAFWELFGITVLSKATLEGAFSDRSYLLEEDIAYWKPTTLGDALFNWWD